MSASSAATEAQIKSEIERLTATINQHKAHHKSAKSGANHYAPYPQVGPSGRGNSYVNPNYKASNKYVRPGLDVPGSSRLVSTATTLASIDASTPASIGTSSMLDKPVSIADGQKKEVVLGGVAFESSRRSLVRKDLPKPSKTAPESNFKKPQHFSHYSKKPGYNPSKSHKMKGRRGQNMTLNNNRRPYPSSRKTANKRVHKYVDKPCPRFNTTGTCSRGLTCMYQHDPSKIAICWNFLQDSCPKTAETCDLSHEPTPERTPLCVHFLNKGRCTRERCPYPHVNVGAKAGVCRDFAVLGYCERGLECDRQHVRECPDFAEKGTCATKGCKLPHVIRANRNRKAAAPAIDIMDSAPANVEDAAATEDDKAMVTAEDGQLGDEYISLTFNESDSDEEEEEEEEEDEEDENM